MGARWVAPSLQGTQRKRLSTTGGPLRGPIRGFLSQLYKGKAFSLGLKLFLIEVGRRSWVGVASQLATP